MGSRQLFEREHIALLKRAWPEVSMLVRTRDLQHILKARKIIKTQAKVKSRILIDRLILGIYFTTFAYELYGYSLEEKKPGILNISTSSEVNGSPLVIEISMGIVTWKGALKGRMVPKIKILNVKGAEIITGIKSEDALHKHIFDRQSLSIIIHGDLLFMGADGQQKAGAGSVMMTEYCDVADRRIDSWPALSEVFKKAGLSVQRVKIAIAADQ